MSGSNKCRIYFCVYFQQGPRGTRGNPPVFHCGLWVEDKSGRGPGDFFHVQFHETRPVNRPDYPEGWVYDSSVARGRRANWRHSGNLIGRILLGKLAAGFTAQHIHQVCQGVALPARHEDCWDWTHRAVEAIQRRNWLHRFAWGGFRTQAQRQAVAWFNSDPQMRRRHEWDMFGTNDSRCVIQ